MDISKVTDQFRVLVPLVKYNEGTGEFEGWATVEQIDKSGETIDLEKSWPYFTTWSETFAKATDGENLGNVREQHDPKKAAGKLTGIEKTIHETGAPGIYVKGIAVDPGTKEKLVKRVLVGLSIGGEYIEKNVDGVEGRYVAKPTEISLVDNPCVPDAMITVVKADGSQTLEKAIGWQPSEQLWKCRAFGAGCLGHVKKDDARGCDVNVSPAPDPIQMGNASKAIGPIEYADGDTLMMPVPAEWNVNEIERHIDVIAKLFPGANVLPSTMSSVVVIRKTIEKAGGTIFEKCLACVTDLANVISGASFVSMWQEYEDETKAGDAKAKIDSAIDSLFAALREIVDDTQADMTGVETSAKASITKAVDDAITALKAETANRSTTTATEPAEKVAAPESEKAATIAKVTDLEKAVADLRTENTELKTSIADLGEMVKRIPTRAKGQLRPVAKENDGKTADDTEGKKPDAMDVMKAALATPNVTLVPRQ